MTGSPTPCRSRRGRAAPDGSSSSSTPGDGSTSSTGAARAADARASSSSTASPQTAWVWAPVARRLRAARRTVALDLRGHGLSDAPTDDGYDLDTLGDDVVAVAEGSGLLDDAAGGTASCWSVTGSARSSRRGRPRGWGIAARGLVLVDGGLGSTCRLDRAGRRRIPARPRRAAGGHALDGRLPRRSARLGSGDLGRRPGAGGPGGGRRDPGRARSCRRPGRTPSAARSRRCSRTGPSATLGRGQGLRSSRVRRIDAGRRAAPDGRPASAGRRIDASSSSRRPATTSCATGPPRSRPRSSAARLSAAGRTTGRPATAIRRKPACVSSTARPISPTTS